MGCSSLELHTRQQALAAEQSSFKLPQLINQPGDLGRVFTHLRSLTEPLACHKVGSAYKHMVYRYCAVVDWILSQPCPIDLISLPRSAINQNRVAVPVRGLPAAHPPSCVPTRSTSPTSLPWISEMMLGDLQACA